MINVVVGDHVRLYAGDPTMTDGWFWDGEVTSVSDGVVLVDFADWIQKWPLSDIREIYDHFDMVLVAHGRGEIVVDHRQKGGW